MVQSGSGFGLTLETAESLGIFSYIVREELQGNEAAQFDVFSLLRDRNSSEVIGGECEQTLQSANEGGQALPSGGCGRRSLRISR